MARIQTRYTYPMTKSKPVRLYMSFFEKFNVYQRLGSLYGGVQIDTSGTHNIKIYRFDGRQKSRFDISDYNVNGGYWSEGIAYDIDRTMAINGYTLVYSDDSSTNPSAFHVDVNEREIYYDLDTTNPIFHVPAVYMDVWYVAIEGSETAGPISQQFRLESRVFAANYEVFNYWFDLRPYPDVIPWEHTGFPIAVGCLPIVQNMMNVFPLAAMRSMLTNATVTIVDGYRIEDEDGNLVDPQEYYSFDIDLETQVFNWFFGSWDVSALPVGKYKVRYRITFDIGPPGAGTMGSEYPGVHTDYWHEIDIAMKLADQQPAPISIPYDTLASLTPAHYLYPFLLYYDANSQRFSGKFFSTVGHLHEPRNVPSLYEDSNNPSPIISWSTDTSSTSSTTFTLSHPPTTEFLPLVFFDGLLVRPSEPLDGSGTTYDYKIQGNILTSLVGAWANVTATYGYRGYSYASGYSDEYFVTSEATLYSGNYYFMLGHDPDLSLFTVYSLDSLVSPSSYTVINSGPIKAYFGQSVLQFTPANYAALGIWVWTHYSYAASSSGATDSHIQSMIDTSGRTTIPLPRFLIGTMTPQLYHGGTFMIPTTDYMFSLGTVGDPSFITLLFTPTNPISVWFN